MKRFFALILALIMIFPLVSCSSSLSDGSSTKEETATEKAAQSEKETGEITLPDSFSAGFARGDITPSTPVLMGGGSTASEILTNLYATCVAVSDGENVALFFHMDMKDIPEKIYTTCANKIEKALGVPASNIIMTGTHTHNSPHTDSTNSSCLQWYKKLYEVIPQVAEEAMRDLAPAEIFTGTGNTDGFAFVRRYLMADGTYKGIYSKNTSTDYLEHETEADPELRTIRFDRGEEKDIVMVNWQAHAASAASKHNNAICSDFIHNLRQGVEEDLDVHFAYFNGGSGNIGVTSYVKERKFSDFSSLGTGLVQVVKDAIKNEEKAESGKIYAESVRLGCDVIQDSDETKSHAREWASASEKDKEAILIKYGFASQYEAISINTRAKMDPVTEVPLYVVTFGDIAIATTPFELFDTSCREIREASPYKMTFSLAYSNGALGYLPPDEIFLHGEYEVYKSFFVAGTAEKCVAEITRMLEDCKNQG